MKKPIAQIVALALAAARPSINILRVASAVKHGQTITINSRVYEITTLASGLVAGSGDVAVDLSASETAVAASGTLTLTTNAGNGETAIIGSQTYTFKTALTSASAANEVLIGATATETLQNLIAAITGGVGAGTKYGSATAVHSSCTAAEGTHVKATQILTSDTTNVTDGDAVVVGGKTYTFQDTLTNVDGNVKIGADAAATLDNLKAAINLAAGAGTTYAAAMTANTQVTATTNTDTTQVVEALTAGAAGNLIASTETSSHLSWGAATLAGGSSKAIITAKAKGTDGNSIASTETLTNGSFGAVTLENGVDPTAGEFTTALIEALEGDGAGACAGERISANEVLLYTKRPGEVFEVSETLAGSNNVFAAASMFGGAQPADELPKASIAKRAATATEVTLQTMHFVFGHPVSAAIVQIRDTNGALKTWDGVVSYSGNRVSLASSGSSDIAATDEVTVLAS